MNKKGFMFCTRRASVIILLIFIVFNSGGFQIIGKSNNIKMTAVSLIQNLKNRIYTGAIVDTIRLNKTPVRNLFVKSAFGIEPLFAQYSKLKWKVEKNCHINISLNSEGIPWDQVLADVLRENNLNLVLRDNYLIVGFQKLQKKDNRKDIIMKKQNKKTLSEINKPEYLKIFKNNIYVSDSGNFKVYSLQTFKLKTVIGKTGQGPGEFLPYPFVENMGKISLNYKKDRIYIGSRNKISVFDLSGNLYKEIRISDSLAYHLCPFGNGYIGVAVKRLPTWLYDFNLYNKNGEFKKKIKDYKKKIHTSGVGNKGLGMVFINRLLKGPEYLVYKDKVYISGAEGFCLTIYNPKGEKINKINFKYQKKKISTHDKKK